MAFSKYATQFKDKDNEIYGVMDEECREEVGSLKSAIKQVSEIDGIGIIGSGSASNSSLEITGSNGQITLNGSAGTSTFFEIDSEITKLSGMTSAHNNFKANANHTYRFTVEKISGSYTSTVNFVIADGASTSLYDLAGTGGSVEFKFTSDKSISIINYVRYDASVSNLVVKITLEDVTYQNITESNENKLDSIEQLYETTQISNAYSSGQNNITSGNRYFPDNIIPKRSILNNVTVYVGASNSGSYVIFEVWELSDDGTTLTRLSTKTISNPTANQNLSIDVYAFNEKRRMISFTKSGCYVYVSNESVAGNGCYDTTDNSSTTLLVSSLTAHTAQKISYSMSYTTATSQKEYVENYGERVTNSNYSTVLPDLDNAPPNVIFDIYSCLHNISNIPSDISSSLTSATFWSFKGDTVNSKNWIVQFIVPNGTTTKVYVRNYMDGSWKAWKELGGVPQDANTMLLDYYVATCVNKAEISIDSTKTILTFGDSITAGSTDTSWTYHFAQMIGCTMNNKAVAGSTFGESISEKWISTQISGVSSAEWDAADYVIVSAGTNDGLHNTPADELKTKVQAAITAIKAETDVPIIFITPIRRNTPSYSENLKLPYISGIITNVAVSNECNVICGFDFPIASETNGQITNLTRDGLHPNATGANVFARSVINALW